MKKYHYYFVIRHVALALLAAITVAQMSFAQQILAVDSRSLQEHVISRVPLVYPAIAKAAHVQGTVVLQVDVDANGEVTATKTVSGPPMLVQAAIDTVRQWTYRPFEKDGAKVSATGRVSLIFSLADGSELPSSRLSSGLQASGQKTVTVVVADKNAAQWPDGGIASQYFPLWHECTHGVLGHSNNSKTVSFCKQAADEADKFPQDERFIEKRSAYVYAAIALANVGDLRDALPYAEKAVAEVDLGHDDDSGDNAAYSIRGQIRGLLGHLADADHDLTIAEDHERRAIASAQNEAPALVPGYQHILQNDLRFHAEALKRMNRPEEAQKKLDEAAKL